MTRQHGRLKKLAAVIEWTPERDEVLEKLTTEPFEGRVLSFSEIANEIAVRFGLELTKCSVIGRARRLGLQKLIAPTVKKASKPKSVRTKARSKVSLPPIPLATLRCAEVDPLLVRLVDLAPCACRYPYGDQTILFCGQPAQPGSSYCPSHHALCWTPVPSRIRHNTERVPSRRAA